MAKLSQTFFESADSIYKDFGFGNGAIAGMFLTASFFSSLAFLCIVFPSLMAAINTIVPLSIGGAVFFGVSFIGLFNPVSLLLGVLAGYVAGSITVALTAVILEMSPAITLLLAAPTLLSVIFATVGTVCSIIEECCACFTFSDGSRSSSGQTNINFASSANHGNSGSSSYGRVMSQVPPAYQPPPAYATEPSSAPAPASAPPSETSFAQKPVKRSLVGDFDLSDSSINPELGAFFDEMGTNPFPNRN